MGRIGKITRTREIPIPDRSPDPVPLPAPAAPPATEPTREPIPAGSKSCADPQ
jgi:hypothetical protein